jgi:arginine decarboxylase
MNRPLNRTDDWTLQEARATYNLPHWSGGYVDVNEAGRLVVRPRRDRARGEVDLYALSREITEAGLALPVLARFTDVLADRVDALCGAFEDARRAHDYVGGYTAVYPIKVNQQRVVVQTIVRHGGARVGLEAGSKPELMAVLGSLPPGDGVIVCNGYKDSEYVRLALIARRLGHRAYIVIEKRSELNLVLAEARRLGVKPLLGVRARLASIGAGKWQNTGGEKSKFGLSAAQLLEAIEGLKAAGALDGLQLLHFHLGSQISNIRDIQSGVGEALRIYQELRRLGAPIGVLDAGGGLGVDYEGTRSRSYYSINYSIAEYANNIVRALAEFCAQESLPAPEIFTESGRALTAHHAVLITNLIDYERVDTAPAIALPGDAPAVLHDLARALAEVEQRPAVESYHDAVHWFAEAQQLFRAGSLDLAGRARAEQLYFSILRAVRERLQPENRAHREIGDELNEKLADKFFFNFSLFQSLPDVWAIDQIFPIVPLARLGERPERRGVIEDLTCDSDGRIDRYVHGDGVSGTLALHERREGEPYLIGVFLVGAYQEILGDMHNLFGDTHAVNVTLDPDGGHHLAEPHPGDTVDVLLRYVSHRPEELMAVYRKKIERAGLAGPEAEAYLEMLQDGLTGYTYLEQD